MFWGNTKIVYTILIKRTTFYFPERSVHSHFFPFSTYKKLLQMPFFSKSMTAKRNRLFADFRIIFAHTEKRKREIFRVSLLPFQQSLCCRLCNCFTFIFFHSVSSSCSADDRIKDQEHCRKDSQYYDHTDDRSS
jgi:hypothetical protein